MFVHYTNQELFSKRNNQIVKTYLFFLVVILVEWLIAPPNDWDLNEVIFILGESLPMIPSKKKNSFVNTRVFS